MQLASYMLVAAVSMSPFSAAAAADVTVSVTGAKGGGLVFVSLCSNAFSPETCPRAQRARPVDGAAAMVFRGVPAGVYAAAAFQDEDGDGRLTRTPVGLPMERFGFSNDVGKTAPPRFQKAAFPVAGDVLVRIVLSPPPK